MPRNTLLIYRIDDEWIFHVPLMGNAVFQPHFDAYKDKPWLGFDHDDRYYLPSVFGSGAEFAGRNYAFVIEGMPAGFTMSQNGKAIGMGGHFNNDGFRFPSIVISYDPAADPGGESGGLFRYRSKFFNADHPGAARESVRLVVEKTFTPTNPEADNSIDHREVKRPERIEAGMGSDSITTGMFDDTVVGGMDDDLIDLSAHHDDHDAVEVGVQQLGEIYVAFDGGDKVTGFMPGQDSLDFTLRAPASEGQQAGADILASLGTGVIVMPGIVFAQANPSISMASGLAAWVNYEITGLEFHFAEAMVLPSGRLTGTILEVGFAPEFHMRGDVFLSRAGEGFDHLLISINQRSVVEELLEDTFQHREGMLGDPAKPDAIRVEIYENHPLNKVIYDADPDPSWAAGGVWSLPETPGLLSDGVMFRIDQDGKLWTDHILDYDAPDDFFANNNYQMKLRYTEPEGAVHDQWLDISVQDIFRERVLGANPTGPKDVVTFTPQDIIDGKTPNLNTVAAAVIGGTAWRMPEQGPLVFTWSLKLPEYSPVVRETYHLDANRRVYRDATPVSESLLRDQATIDTFRALVERAFAEYERLMNVKMIEVARTSHQAGEVEMIYAVDTEKNGPSGFASVPRPGRSDIFVQVINAKNANGIGFPASYKITSLGFSYSTLVHEIGHFFGLKHPFSGFTLKGKSLGWPVYGDNNHPPEGDIFSVMNWGREELEGDALVYQNDLDALLFLYGAAGTDFKGVESVLKNWPGSIDLQINSKTLSFTLNDKDGPTDIRWVLTETEGDQSTLLDLGDFNLKAGTYTITAHYTDFHGEQQAERDFEVIADYFPGSPTLPSEALSVPARLNTILKLGQLPVDDLLVVVLDGNTASASEHGRKVRDEVKAYLPKGVQVELILSAPETHYNFPPDDLETARGSIDAFTSNSIIEAHDGPMIVVSASNLHPAGLTERYDDVLMIKAAGNYGGTRDPHFKYQGDYVQSVLESYGDQLMWVVGLDGEDTLARHTRSSKAGDVENVFAAPFQTTAGVTDAGTSFAAPYFAAQVAKLWLVLQKFGYDLEDLLPVLKTLADDGDEGYDQIGHGKVDLNPLVRQEGDRVFLDTSFFETHLPDITFPQPDGFDII